MSSNIGVMLKAHCVLRMLLLLTILKVVLSKNFLSQHLLWFSPIVGLKSEPSVTVSGIIPHIKHLAKSSTKIIYRSHIEIRADLIRQDPTGPQAETWHYLWENFIRHADLFISHPVSNFVPDDLPLHKVVLMPATTDPLDGLNKAMENRDILYYQQVFNRTCSDQGSQEMDWERPYIVQVARFDPSKGWNMFFFYFIFTILF